jgi:NitT/TauT family transport system substrate-binding protein
MKLRWFFFGFLLIIVLLAGCAPAEQNTANLNVAEPTIDEVEPVPISLPLGYIPNVQFAPLYVSAEKGYFAEAGYEVTFDYRFETDGVALVGQGELPFAVASGEQVLLAREQGVPVVYVMAWFQDFPVGVVANSDSGIAAPQDLAGRKIGLPGLYGASYIGLRAFLSANGLKESDVVLDSIGFNQVEALSAGQDDAVVVYVTNEPIQLEAQGYEIEVFPVADYVHLAANGVVTNETMISDHPEQVRAFVQAFLRGLADTIADPEEAYQISMNYVENLAEADQDIQMEVLMQSIEFWQADLLGYSQQESWQNMQQVLLDMGLLVQQMPLDEAFTNQFVD